MNTRVSRISADRRIGSMGSASVEVELEVDDVFDPLVGGVDFGINRFVQLHAGWRQVTGLSPQGGPAPQPVFAGLVDSYGQVNRGGSRRASVNLTSLFKDVTKMAPRGLVYESETTQTLMESIARREGHIPLSRMDFSGVNQVSYTKVTSRGSSVVDVLVRLAEAAQCVLIETADGVLKAKPYPVDELPSYQVEATDHIIEHRRGDADFTNTMVIYGRKFTPSDLSGTSMVIYDRIHTIDVIPSVVGAPTINLGIEFQIAPIDINAGIDVAVEWYLPSGIPSAVLVDVLTPTESLMRIYRVDDLGFAGQVSFRLVITGYPKFSAWEQELKNNSSSDQTRLSARVKDEVGIGEYGQVLEGRVVNDYIMTEADCTAVGNYHLKLNRWRRDELVVVGPLDPRIEVGDSVIVPYEGVNWRCAVEGIHVEFNPSSSGLMGKMNCVPMERYEGESL